MYESNVSRWDWCFNLFGIPVRITPFFWLFGVLFSPFLRMGDSFNMRLQLIALFAWCLAWLLSFLIHEFGHALVLKQAFGARPWIVLGFGGWTEHEPIYRRMPGWKGRIFYMFAGSGAELLVALVTVGFLVLFGCQPVFGLDSLAGVPFPFIMVEELSEWISAFNNLGLFFAGCFFFSFLWMSFFWGLLNLLPIYPMDGGKILLEFMMRIDPRRGRTNALSISIMFAIALAVLSFMQGQVFIACFFVFFAYVNFQQINARR